MALRAVVVCVAVLECGIRAAESGHIALDRGAAEKMAAADYKGAAALERRAISMARAELAGRRDTVLAAYLARLGQIDRELALFDEAKSALDEAVRIYESAAPADSLGLASALTTWARCIMRFDGTRKPGNRSGGRSRCSKASNPRSPAGFRSH